MRNRGEAIDRERLGDTIILFLNQWPYSHPMAIFATKMKPSLMQHEDALMYLRDVSSLTTTTLHVP